MYFYHKSLIIKYQSVFVICLVESWHEPTLNMTWLASCYFEYFLINYTFVWERCKYYSLGTYYTTHMCDCSYISQLQLWALVCVRWLSDLKAYQVNLGCFTWLLEQTKVNDKPPLFILILFLTFVNALLFECNTKENVKLTKS